MKTENTITIASEDVSTLELPVNRWVADDFEVEIETRISRIYTDE